MGTTEIKEIPGMKCAYCGKEAKGTKEHIISCSVLDLFPECYLTLDETRGVVHQADPVVKDVCAKCNNEKLSYIDDYAKNLISQYFTRKYAENDELEIEFNYVMVQKMLLKYAFNDLRAHSESCAFFDDEMLHYLLNETDESPKGNVTVLCGLAVNVTPLPDAAFGNLKLRWCKDPLFLSNSTVLHIDYDTGKIVLNEDVETEHFQDLQLSYAFRFNSVQFILLCWDKSSQKIESNNAILRCQYPYHLMKVTEGAVALPVCTNEVNYCHFEHIHVKWDGLFEVGRMRKLASRESYQYKEQLEKEWEKEEEILKRSHLR